MLYASVFQCLNVFRSHAKTPVASAYGGGGTRSVR